MSVDYEQIKKDLDAASHNNIKKILKRCAKNRATQKGAGTVIDDWDQLRKAYETAMSFVLDNIQKHMDVGGVLRFCNYTEEVDEDA